VIRGEVYIDLTLEPDTGSSQERRKLQVLQGCPDGAVVVVDIGRRNFVTHDAATWLHEHAGRLAITIRGTDPQAVAHFVSAARAGDWTAVA